MLNSNEIAAAAVVLQRLERLEIRIDRLSSAGFFGTVEELSHHLRRIALQHPEYEVKAAIFEPSGDHVWTWHPSFDGAIPGSFKRETRCRWGRS